MSTQPDRPPVPFDLDDPAVIDALLQVFAAGMCTGASSTVISSGVDENTATLFSLYFARRAMVDPLSRDQIVTAIRGSLTGDLPTGPIGPPMRLA